MKLSDIFDQLATGELSQLALVDSTQENINPTDYNRVINQVNMGLSELHKRFMLKRKTLQLQTLADVIRYPLTSKHSQSGGAVLPYILDIDEPFEDDIVEILVVKDAQNKELPLNEYKATATLGVLTPAYNIIRFSEDVAPSRFEVIYQASHVKVPKVVDPDTFDASKVDIELPMTHLEALLFYIASRVISPINGAVNGAPQEGMQYAQRFEQSCQDLLLQGLDVAVTKESTRFSRNGFV